MPTFDAIRAGLYSASVASAVATLPATSCASGKRSFTAGYGAQDVGGVAVRAVQHPARPPPASSSAALRSSTSAVTPMAAAHSRRPAASLAELGYLSTFSMSLS